MFRSPESISATMFGIGGALLGSFAEIKTGGLLTDPIKAVAISLIGAAIGTLLGYAGAKGVRLLSK